MRCVCCNRLLSNYETSLKSKMTNEYLDMCLKCLDGLGIAYTGNSKLHGTTTYNLEDNDDPI